MFGPVDQLMRQGGGMTLGIAESLKRRHLHEIRPFGIIGARATMAHFRAGCRKEAVMRMQNSYNIAQTRKWADEINVAPYHGKSHLTRKSHLFMFDIVSYFLVHL
jgi:hypothetical protein